MSQKSSKKTLRWWVLYSVAGIVDLIQIVIDFTGVGIVVSEALELAMPFIIAIILLGFRMLNMQTGISVVVAVVLDALTGGFAPFWVGDIYYIRGKVMASEAAQAAGQEEEAELAKRFSRNPYNETGEDGKGIRMPRKDAEEDNIIEFPEQNRGRNQDLRPTVDRMKKAA